MKKPAWSVDARTGPVRKFMDLSVFACEGLICIIDERPGKDEGQANIVTPKELKERITAVNQPYRGKTRAQLDKFQRAQMDKRIQGAENCMECIREAREMGDPSDPKVQAYWQRHQRNSSVSLSAGCDAAGYPQLPTLGAGAGVIGSSVPQQNVTQGVKLHKKPVRKNRSGLIT